jgi:hypothetical protein
MIVVRIFDIYIENPDVCSLLILKDQIESSIHGRALLWILDDGYKYMDRGYTNRNGLDGLFEVGNLMKMDISR